jgi:hypothetical protein
VLGSLGRTQPLIQGLTRTEARYQAELQNALIRAIDEVKLFDKMSLAAGTRLGPY